VKLLSLISRPYSYANALADSFALFRISALIQDVKDGIEMYKYIVSWKNPLLTGVSLLIFLRMCIRFNPAYIGGLPFFLLMMFMLYLAGRRSFGKVRNKYIQKEIESNRKVCDGPLIM